MSRISTGIAEIASIAFHRASNTPIDANTPAVVDGVTVASIDADGLLSFHPSLVSEIIVASGVTVRGLRALHSNGDPYDAADEPPLARLSVMVRAAEGGAITISHEDGTILEPTERTATAYGTSVTVGPDAVWLTWQVDGGARRWRAPVIDVYSPGDALEWSG